MKKINIVAGAVLLVAAAAGAIVAHFGQPTTAMAGSLYTVELGQTIQEVIDSAEAGDMVVVPAGTYTENLSIRKPLALVGEGDVTIKTKSTAPSANKGLDIQNVYAVRIENITFDGENGDPTKQTGIDINSAKGVILRDVTVKNYAKNGIAVTTQHDSSYVDGGNVTFEDVTVDQAAWAGIAFYTRSSLAHDVALTDIKFVGTTKVSGTKYGIQFGDSNGQQPITGVDGAPVALGTVVFAGNEANISNDSGETAITLASDSTIDGQPVTASDFPGLEVTITSSEKLVHLRR